MHRRERRECAEIKKVRKRSTQTNFKREVIARMHTHVVEKTLLRFTPERVRIITGLERTKSRCTPLKERFRAFDLEKEA